MLDCAFSHYADRCATLLQCDLREVPGAGAADGMGFAAITFLNAHCRPGVEVVAQLVDLAGKLQSANLVITGEGRCDTQTLHGKTPIGVARMAQRAGIPVVILAGTLGEGYETLYRHGIDAAFALVSRPMSLADACSQAPQLLEARAGDIARLWQRAKAAG